MGTGWLALYLFCLAGHGVNAQLSGFTFDPSSQIKLYFDAPEIEDCRKLCASTEGCRGFTTYTAPEYPTHLAFVCLTFSDDRLAATCQNCHSGVLDEPEKYETFGSGECVPTNTSFLEAKPATAPHQCMEHCREAKRCNYFTWTNDQHMIKNMCYLFSECSYDIQHQSCPGRLTGAMIKPETLLLVGGVFNSMIVWSSDSAADITFAPLPEPTKGGNRAAVLGDTVYTCGGYDNNNHSRNVPCYKASVEGGAWSPAASMINGRRYHTLTPVGNHLVAAGGYRDHDEEFGFDRWDSVEIFTEGQGWEMAPWKLDAGNAGHCTVAVSDTEIIVLSDTKYGSPMTVAKYNIVNGTRTPLSAPPGPSIKYRRTCVTDSSWIYLSAHASGEDSSHHIWRYAISTDEWEPLPQLEQAEFNHYGLALADGQLTTFAFGREPNVQVLKNLEEWQSAENQLPVEQEAGFANGGIVVLPPV